MSTFRRRQMMAAAHGGGSLPYDAEVEYLKSTGTQYIELDFGFDVTDEVTIVGSIEGSGGDKYMVAPKTWNNNNNRFAILGRYASRFCAMIGNKGSENRFDNASNQDIHTWTYKNKIFTISGVASKDFSDATFGSETDNLRLFFGYNSCATGKIVSYEHIKNNVKVADLIPVRVGQVGYMYDRVSGRSFGNDGTGSFTLGPDKT